MGISNDQIEDLENEIRQIFEQKPHMANLLQAFAPLFLEKRRWLHKGGETQHKFVSDPLKYLEGIPLIRQYETVLPEDSSWEKAGLAVTGAIREGFPDFGKDMACLSSWIEDGSLDCSSFFSSSPEEEQHPAQSEDIRVGTEVFGLFKGFLRRFILTKWASDNADELASQSWKKGYCPVCGSLPLLAVLRDKGQRWLQCPDCSFEWQFPRLVCPACDCENPENTEYMFVEGKKDDTAFICNNCKRYLLTVNRPGNIQQTSSDILAISLTHLDMILQKKGFLPMVECEWNTFQIPREAEG